MLQVSIKNTKSISDGLVIAIELALPLVIILPIFLDKRLVVLLRLYAGFTTLVRVGGYYKSNAHPLFGLILMSPPMYV